MVLEPEQKALEINIPAETTWADAAMQVLGRFGTTEILIIGTILIGTYLVSKFGGK